MMDSLDFMARWLLSFGKSATIEQPEELKQKVAELAEELFDHYKSLISLKV
jgi:predicted DNA-binding transcriptional regulator YafY